MGAFLSRSDLPPQSARLNISVPAQEPVNIGDDFLSAGQSLAQLQGQLEAQSEKEAALAERKRRALEVSVVSRRSAIAVEALSNIRHDIPMDPNINPLEYRDAYNKRAKEIMDRAVVGLSEQATNELVASIQGASTQLGANLDLEGTKRFIEADLESLNNESKTLTELYGRAETPEERLGIINQMSLALDRRVKAGTITRQQAKNAADAFRDGAEDSAVEFERNRDPAAHMAHLVDLTNGGEGNPNMTVPRNIAEALEKTQTEYHRKWQFQEQQRAAAERAHAKAQDANNRAMITRIWSSAQKPEEFSGIFADIGRLGKGDRLADTHVGQLYNLLNKVQDDYKKGLDVDTDPQTIRDVIELSRAGKSDQAVSMLMDQAGKTVKVDELPKWVGWIQGMAKSNHVFNDPVYTATEDRIKGQLGPSSPLFNRLAGQQGFDANAVLNEALYDFRLRVLSGAGQDGTLKENIIPQTPDLGDRVINAYKEQMKRVVEGQERGRRGNIEADIVSLVNKARESIATGVPEEQVFNWVGRELSGQIIDMANSKGLDWTDPAQYNAARIAVMESIRKGITSGKPPGE